jgi:hypothetical protein
VVESLQQDLRQLARRNSKYVRLAPPSQTSKLTTQKLKNLT